MSSSRVAPDIPRSRYPVFVVGCHRSGTNLMYDTLLSAGGFAIYRGYLPIHKMLIPRFGNPAKISYRRNIIQAWMKSKGFRRSGLDAQELSAKLLAHASNGSQFIQTVMDDIACAQDVPRWAVYDPDNVLFIAKIKAELPQALFVHMVRDGRDIALSLNKMGEFRPFPWNRKPASLLATALYWKWMVETGRQQGRFFPADYIEIHFEDLVLKPHETLGVLGTFIGQDLNYRHIQSAGLGRLQETNSSFRAEGKQDPVARWKSRLSPAQVHEIECLVGDCLMKSGYQLSGAGAKRPLGRRIRMLKSFYPKFLSIKQWLKTQTIAGKFNDLQALELRDKMPRDEATDSNS